jgi:hypothetical protein
MLAISTPVTEKEMGTPIPWAQRHVEYDVVPTIL